MVRLQPFFERAQEHVRRLFSQLPPGVNDAGLPSLEEWVLAGDSPEDAKEAEQPVEQTSAVEKACGSDAAPEPDCIPADLAAAGVGFRSSLLSSPRMSVAILVVGTRGDVQPFWELGKRLREDGHRVRLATHADYRDYVRSGGLEFYPLGGDPKKLSKYMCKTGGRLLPNVLDKDERDSIPEKQGMLSEMMFNCWPAVSEPEPDVPNARPFCADAIVSNPVTYGHIHVAERLDVPVHLMFPVPWTPTGEFPHPISVLGIGCKQDQFQPGRLESRRRAQNFLTYFGVDEFLYTGMRFTINQFRNSIGLEPIRAGEKGAHLVHQHQVPFAYLWSPHILPRPEDYGAHVDVTGTIFNNDTGSYDPPADFLEWLDAGEKPVFVGFGSMIVEKPQELAEVILEAAIQSGTRVVLQSSWSELTNGKEGQATEEQEEAERRRMVYYLGNCPHDWLFTRVCAVVHHGGAGTVAAGLRAGLPTMICPFFGDQHLWAQALKRQGVSVEPVPIERLTAPVLASSLVALRGEGTRGAEILARARQMGQLLADEDGVAGVVDAFYKHLPMEGMACDVSLMLGPDRDVRMARWYSPHLGLKVCHEVMLSLRSALPAEDFRKCGFVEYRHSMAWGFADPENITTGFIQGVQTAFTRYAQAGAGLIVTPLKGGFEGYQAGGGVQGAVNGSAKGVVQGVHSAGRHIVRGTQRIFTRPMQAWRNGGATSSMARRIVRRPAATAPAAPCSALAADPEERDQSGGVTKDGKDARGLLPEEVELEERKQLLRAYEAAQALQRAWAKREPILQNGDACIHLPLSVTQVAEVVGELRYPESVQETVLGQLKGVSVPWECAAEAPGADDATAEQGSASARLWARLPKPSLFAGAQWSWKKFRKEEPRREVPDVSFEGLLSLLQPYGMPPEREALPISLRRTDELLTVLLAPPS